ncbi:MAG: hypothetical protein IPL53_14990 [Ignavibacteria bacterium]|nr:hypothetical protein [Ignavibacteria bacterium]
MQWQTNMSADPVADSKNPRHELLLKFPKPKNAGEVKLLVNAGTAQWGGYMIKAMLNMRGDKVDQWYEDINNKGPEYFKLYKFMEREELYFLKVNSLENNKWVTRGMISAGGPFIDEDRIIEINAGNVTGDTLFIKLNPPLGYWKFDYCGLIYESAASAKVTEATMIFAKNEKGADLMTALSAADGYYYDMPDSTSTANLEFEKTGYAENMSMSLYLKTTGYYDIHLKKDKPEETELIENIYSTPGLIVEISLNEYVKKIKSLGALNK